MRLLQPQALPAARAPHGWGLVGPFWIPLQLCNSVPCSTWLQGTLPLTHAQTQFGTRCPEGCEEVAADSACLSTDSSCLAAWILWSPPQSVCRSVYVHVCLCLYLFVILSVSMSIVCVCSFCFTAFGLLRSLSVVLSMSMCVSMSVSVCHSVCVYVYFCVSVCVCSFCFTAFDISILSSLLSSMCLCVSLCACPCVCVCVCVSICMPCHVDREICLFFLALSFEKWFFPILIAIFMRSSIFFNL